MSVLSPLRHKGLSPQWGAYLNLCHCRKLGHLESFVHFHKTSERGRERKSYRKRKRVLKREELGEQEDGRDSRDWS